MATRHDPADEPDATDASDSTDGQGDSPTAATSTTTDSGGTKSTEAADAREGTANGEGTRTRDATAAGTAAGGTAAGGTAAAGTRTKEKEDSSEPTRREKLQGTSGGAQTREQRLATEALEHRRESAYQLARARGRNRGSTDFGLLLLRVLPLTMFLHGLGKAQGFSAFRDTVASNSFGALAPDVFAIMVVAGQLALPILIALGFLTRVSGLLMAVMMAFIWVTTQLPQGLLDSRGGLVGEAAYLFVATSLPLLFTGPGRFSIDHAIFGRRADARAHRRADKAVA